MTCELVFEVELDLSPVLEVVIDPELTFQVVC